MKENGAHPVGTLIVKRFLDLECRRSESEMNWNWWVQCFCRRLLGVLNNRFYALVILPLFFSFLFKMLTNYFIKGG